MHETADDLRELTDLLDRSYAGAGDHMKSIFTPERRISAEDLVALLPGVQVLNLATVTRDCAPRVAPVDGLFYRGRFWFGSAASSVRFTHLRQRPQVSAAHTRGEELAVIVHGTATLVDRDDPAHAGFAAYYRDVYDFDWHQWDIPVQFARIDATHLYTYRPGGA